MTTTIIPLSEGEFSVGRDKIFHPFDLQNDEINERAVGSLLVEVQPFALANEQDILLLDAGLGINHPQGQEMLLDNLAKANIEADEVSKILMTHLHKDHAGGLDPDLFPNATIYIYRPEFESAMAIGMPSYYVDDLKKLEQHPRVHWLEESSGVIDDYIRYQHTGGHSPQHIVFWIASDDGLIFFGGDEAPQFKQMKMKYVAKYDHDGQRAMNLRQTWAEQGTAEGWTFLFYHDIQNSVVKM